MAHPNHVLLYVDNVAVSAAFYGRLLAVDPVEHSSGFALFALENGGMLGLWARPGVEPQVTAPAGGMELGICLTDSASVNALFNRWSGQGVEMIMPPKELDFGHSFVATDPDGHRIRVFALGEAA